MLFQEYAITFAGYVGLKRKQSNQTTDTKTILLTELIFDFFVFVSLYVIGTVNVQCLCDGV